MLEFVFFHPEPRDRFADFVVARGIGATRLDDDETLGIGIPEDVDEGLLEEIEAFYDEMMVLNQQLFEADGDESGGHTAGVVLNLKSGETIYAQVDPLILGRIMAVLSPEEFGGVVNAIVDAIETPDSRPLCKRVQD